MTPVICEIKKVDSKTTASMDKEYRVTLVTDDDSLMQLSVLPADTLVKVTFEVSDGAR